VSYRVLKRRLSLDDDLEDLKEDVIYAKKLAVDEEGCVLVWVGGTTASPASAHPAQSAQEPEPHEAAHAEVLPSAPPTSDAERRQLTVMFCDLVDSTTRSRQLDPEDLRDVICAYQETAAGMIQRYDGYIAQYLGDGLLVYFGPPSFPEPAVPRPSQRKPPASSASRILSRLSRPRKAAPRRAARRCSGLPPRAGGAAGAGFGQRPPARGSGMPRGCVQGCAREEPAIQCCLYVLSVDLSYSVRYLPLAASLTYPAYHA
jgi:class 3 adenylate cyclase